MIAKNLKETGWVVGTLVKVFLPTTAIALAVGLPLWFAMGDVAVVATSSLVIGALGAGVWYRRYFKRIKERTRRATHTGSSALALVGVLSLAGAPQLYAYAEATFVENAAVTASAVSGWEKDYPGLWDTRVLMCVTPDGEVVVSEAGVTGVQTCTGWEVTGIVITCMACSFALAACPAFIFFGLASPFILLAALVDCLGALALCYSCFDQATDCDDPDVTEMVDELEERVDEAVRSAEQLEEALQAVCASLEDNAPQICDEFLDDDSGY